jgi:hypothetical protein
MFGPEPWKTVGGETFTHWDRWLLALATHTPAGWAGVRTAISTRTKTRLGFKPADDDTEAKLAQVDDLVEWLKRAGLTRPRCYARTPPTGSSSPRRARSSSTRRWARPTRRRP